eukprot:TRINITY_DN6636_c0_g1_i2.p1 TRINITY_DN6636_c0_g1~~TRINITY_DN6636_c0_g1_i2.p1  ORF type:complete len:414 (+),score=95.52 TRINITY_DN6636_c0_g1_i2:347-1588(+)
MSKKRSAAQISSSTSDDALDEGDEQTGQGGGKRTVTLEKNRQAARESRLRRKEYLLSLEQEIENLQKEVSRLKALKTPFSKEELTEARRKIIRKVEENYHRCKLGGHAQTWALLEQELDNLDNLASDSVFEYVNYHLARISECLVPFSDSKFILWGLDQDDAFYQEDPSGQNQGVWGILCNELQLSPEQKLMFRSARASVRAHQAKHADSLRKVKEMSTVLIETHRTLKILLTHLRSGLTSEQLARYLLWTERNKACIQLAEQLWEKEVQVLGANAQPGLPSLPPGMTWTSILHETVPSGHFDPVTSAVLNSSTSDSSQYAPPPPDHGSQAQYAGTSSSTFDANSGSAANLASLSSTTMAAGQTLPSLTQATAQGGNGLAALAGIGTGVPSSSEAAPLGSGSHISSNAFTWHN